jgi:hypothetical protein
MKRLLLLLPFLLAGCETTGDASLDALLGREPEPEAPAPLPPQVLAALPSGVPPTVVTRNADGCYLITLERTDPPTGFPLTDVFGNRVCEARVAPAAPLVAAPGLVPGAPPTLVAPSGTIVQPNPA